MEKEEMMHEKGVGKEIFGWDDIFGYEDVKEKAKRIARFAKAILIHGESGTGKRLFANAIHNEVRGGKPFLVVHCPNIQPALFESEIFGHRKGAFTDAKEEKAGKIESAGDGTIFFDEIGNVSTEIQSKLLRVIEERRFYRLGDNRERETNALFIFATNKELGRMIEEGLFLEDLYYRIEIFTLEIPPLRKRKEFREIAKGLWERVCKEQRDKGNDVLQIEPLNEKEIEIFSNYSFPGNIRELEGIMKRVLMEILEAPESSRSEIIAMEIEKRKEKAEKMMRIGNEWHSRRIYKDMKGGKLNFWEIRKAYLNHELNKYQLEEIIREGLKETDGSLKGLLPIFHIEERDYKKFQNFLHAQGIKLQNLQNSDQSQNRSDYSQKNKC